MCLLSATQMRRSCRQASPQRRDGQKLLLELLLRQSLRQSFVSESAIGPVSRKETVVLT